MSDEQLQAKFDEINQKIDSLKNLLQSISSKIDSQTGAISSMDTKINELRNLTPENFKSTFDLFEKRLSELSYKLFKL